MIRNSPNGLAVDEKSASPRYKYYLISFIIIYVQEKCTSVYGTPTMFVDMLAVARQTNPDVR
jgi:hypothetical protein